MGSTYFDVSRRKFLSLCGAAVVSALSPALARAEEDGVTLSPMGINELGEYAFSPEEELTLDDESLTADAVEMASSGGVRINEVKGATRYETAAAAARNAAELSGGTSSTVLVASGNSYADSIAAAGLAGILDCPVVLSDYDAVPNATLDVMRELRVSSAILLGGENVISTSAESQVRGVVGSVVRLAGPTRYETQMKIYEYGSSRGWGSTAVVTTGEEFADALAASPVSFALKAPVFFVNAEGALPEAQVAAIEANTSLVNFLVIGGTARIPASVEGYLEGVSAGRGGSVARLSGETRYETSAAVATYAVKNLGFSWDGVAFTSGLLPYDALASAALQGKTKAPLLLADETSIVSAKSVGRVSSLLTYLGGYDAVSLSTRTKINSLLGISSYGNVSTTSYNVSLSKMAALEEAIDRNYGKNSYEAFREMLDPNKFDYGTYQFFQFAVLNEGYSGASASSLDAYVEQNCGYSETTYGRTSGLRKTGSYFVNAAKSTGVNEVYLLAHAIWESAWGCSQLAAGWTPGEDGVAVINGKNYPYYKGQTYYNFYGIGAYDANALAGGRAMAVKEGWTSPEKAILGAAKWIASNYLNRVNGRQNTLYLMKFDLPDAVKSNSVWHQYCTGGNNWVLGIANVMVRGYKKAGYAIDEAPVRFDVPSYSGN